MTVEEVLRIEHNLIDITSGDAWEGDASMHSLDLAYCSGVHDAIQGVINKIEEEKQK